MTEAAISSGAVITTVAQAVSMSNPTVFMDIEIDGAKTGRIAFELFANVVPITAENVALHPCPEPFTTS